MTKRRVYRAIAVAVLLALAMPGGVLAATPIAHDDPQPACFGPAFGGSFPIPEDYAVVGDEDGWFLLSGGCALTANDTDADGDALTYEIASDPDHGEVLKLDENFTAYRPEADYSTIAGNLPSGTWLSDSFTYRACDATECSDPATMRFWIAPINDPPTFVPGPASVTVDEDSGPYSGSWATSVSAGPAGSGESGQVVTFEIVSNDLHDLFAVQPAISSNGRLTFTPRADWYGQAHIVVRAKDDGGLENYGLRGLLVPPDDTSDAAAFDIVVDPVDDPIVAVNDAFAFDEDSGSHTLSLLINDLDVDHSGQPSLSITATSTPTKGAVAITPGGAIYTPTANANGTDTFDYTVSNGSSTDVGTVTVTITPVQDPPVADDDEITLLEDAGPTAVNVLAGDDDVDGDTLRITETTDPAHGVVAITGGGSGVAYTPDSDYNGPDGFDYTVSDDHGGSDVGSVAVTITPVNDVPVAEPDALSIPAEGIPVDVHVLANDTDVDGDDLTITGHTASTKGMVVVDDGATALTYQPFHGLFGPDNFEYTVSDGHGGTATALVTVTITSDNHPPNAVNDARNVPQGAGATPLAVLANDQDADGNSLTITAGTNGAHGTVVIMGGGTGLTYNPVNSYHGIDTFTYTISDGLASDTATVRVTVVPDTAPPLVIAPTERIPVHRVGTSTTKAKLTWSATDPGSGVKRYRLQVSVDGRAWKSIALPKNTSTSITRSLKTGHTYRFRVRAMDGEGNVSAYVKGPLLKPVRYSEASASITYTGAWTKAKTKKAVGGATRHATASTKRATFAFTGYDVGWIATEATTSGKAHIYIDGTLAATIDLDRTKTAYRGLIFARHFATLATHTLEIQPVGDGRVDVDGFVILR